jgi:hypothetical protein
MLMVP